MAQPFSSGPRFETDAQGDPKRQAIASLRGYVYQLYASALAWTRLSRDAVLYLEVAEDYAVAVKDALAGVQVRETAGSGSVTINNEGVQTTIDSFVDLLERNPGKDVTLRFLSTSPIGREKEKSERINGEPVLEYWRKAASGADVAPLRSALLNVGLSARANKFIKARDDAALRAEFLRKIQWDCGQPPLEDLKQELTDSLVGYGFSEAGLPSQASSDLAPKVLSAVIDTTLLTERRRLSMADLVTLCSEAHYVTVPRNALGGQVPGTAAGASGTRSTTFASLDRFLDLEEETPMPSHVVARKALVSELQSRFSSTGSLFLSGATGMGKTLLARLIAQAIGGRWYLADFRDATATEAARRLRDVQQAIQTESLSGIIFNDLNEVDDPVTAKAYARLARRMKRRDAVCVATVYREPSTALLDELGLPPAAVFPVPILGEPEVGELVEQMNGDPATWSAHVHRWGGHGHPQLVRGVLVGLADRGWPEKELSVAFGAPTLDDIEAVRTHARKRLLNSLPENTRRLLFRLSLLIGRFERSLAVKVAGLNPSVDFPGDRLDALVGPWIDLSAQGKLRTSPLLSQAGVDALHADEQRTVHETAAEFLTEPETLDARTGDAAFRHALRGDNGLALTKIAIAVLATRPSDYRDLASWLPHLVGQSTRAPIFPGNHAVSLQLRLGQLLLAGAVEGDARVAQIWESLQRELAEPSVAGQEVREHFEVVVLSKALASESLAARLPNWVNLLVRCNELFKTEAAKEDGLDLSKTDGDGMTATGMLFITQAGRVSTVELQLKMFEALGLLDTHTRNELLSSALAQVGALTFVVDSPWLEERKSEAFSWRRAAEAFATMSALAEKWAHRELAIRCCIARAVMLDEYGLDEGGALEGLEAAIAHFGPDPLLSRAKAKLHYRHKRHSHALESLGEHRDEIAKDDPLERAYVCREAGISAAELGHWDQASLWFDQAYEAMKKRTVDSLQAMRVGLRGDQAVALYKAGSFKEATLAMADALTQSVALESDESLAAIYCRRILGHAALWMSGEATDTDYEIGSTLASVIPGMCSNPEPRESARDAPPAPIEATWYQFATVEYAHLGVTMGEANLRLRLAGKCIPRMELVARNYRLMQSIQSLDVEGFVESIEPWLEGILFFHVNMNALHEGSDARAALFAFGDMPRVDAEHFGTPRARDAVRDAALAFGITAALRRNGTSLREVQARLTASVKFPIALELFGKMTSPNTSGDDLATYTCQRIYRQCQPGTLSGEELFASCLRFWQATRNSQLAGAVSKPLAIFAAHEWRKLVETQAFSLLSPRTMVPKILAAVTRETEPLKKVAGLLAVSQPAVRVKLNDEFLAAIVRAAS